MISNTMMKYYILLPKNRKENSCNKICYSLKKNVSIFLIKLLIIIINKFVYNKTFDILYYIYFIFQNIKENIAEVSEK